MRKRGRWQGMWTIVRFNWPFYAVALVSLVICGTGAVCWWGSFAGWALGLVCGGVVYFLIGSLGVAHFIYDRSDLYRFGWLVRALGEKRVRRGIFCHSGFDEVSAMVREMISPGQWLVIDHYDEALMGEPSIRRARRAFPPDGGTVAAGFDRWPADDGWADVIFGILAVHELREHAERVGWFREAGRCLVDGRRVILVEHLRDVPNLLAFGPGFLHFHSRESWKKCWEEAGLVRVDEFGITPWVRCFVLEKR